MLEPHLKSQVGRRLFVRFLLAALLPMAGLAFHAYTQVSATLVETAQHRLMLDAKAYGMSLVERLDRRAAALRLAVAQGDGAVSELPVGFASIERVELSASASADVAATPAAPRLLLQPQRPPELQLASGWVGRLQAERFWVTDAAPEHYCVFSLQGEALHCSPELADSPAPAVPVSGSDHNMSAGEARIAGEDFLLGAWRARYLPSLDSAGFVILAASPKALELQALNRYRMVFSAAVLLAIALAAGLSNSQIRRQLAPLLKLRASTQRLSAGELGARSEVSGEDEFGELGQAFDRMAGRLEQKFHVLGLLSALDRAVLAASSRDAVVHTLLGDLQPALPCLGAGVLCLQPDGAAELLCRPSARAADAAWLRVRIDSEHVRGLPSGVVWRQLSPTALPAEAAQALCGVAPGCLLAFPVHLNRSLDSVLLIAFERAPEDLDEVMQIGRSLADRLSLSATSLERERRLYRQAHYDALTGLPNRLLLMERMQQAIAHAERSRTSVALMFLDLDRFKQVNDTLGHADGDLLLMEYAQRLRGHARGEDTVARLGGDEFVILLEGLASETAFASLDRIAQDLQAALESPFQLGAQSVVVQSSLGIALYPDNAVSPGDLLKMADEAMYDSKRRLPGGYGFYTSNISAATRERFELTQELREAIQRNEFLLHYQPKVEAASGRLTGAEALLRWQSPQRGLILPGRFLHLLDEMGLGTWLGEWVLEQACAQMRVWDVQGFAPFPVSINLSPLQFERTPVVERVRDALHRHGLSPARLELEILESLAANQSREIRGSLSALRALGVRIALDDFGTGFSSLVHLTEVPADILKLDRVFTLGLCADLRQREIVRSIIDIARVMQLDVVAEGVETEAQRALLPTLGCHLLQGYLIGRPVAPESFAQRWLATAMRPRVQ